MNEENDVTFSMIQSGMRKARHPLVVNAAFAGSFVASMGRSYSGSRLSSYSLEAGNYNHSRRAGEEGPPD
jgi:hypothetical protein